MSTRYDYVILKEIAFVINIFRKTVWYFFGPIMHSFINQAKQGQTVYRKLCMYKNGKTNWQMMKIQKKRRKKAENRQMKKYKESLQYYTAILYYKKTTFIVKKVKVAQNRWK